MRRKLWGPTPEKRGRTEGPERTAAMILFDSACEQILLQLCSSGSRMSQPRKTCSPWFGVEDGKLSWSPNPPPPPKKKKLTCSLISTLVESEVPRSRIRCVMSSACGNRGHGPCVFGSFNPQQTLQDVDLLKPRRQHKIVLQVEPVLISYPERHLRHCGSVPNQLHNKPIKYTRLSRTGYTNVVTGLCGDATCDATQRNKTHARGKRRCT